MSHQAPSLFDWNIVGPAVADSFRKLDPRVMIRNPVMFVTLVGAVLTTASLFYHHLHGGIDGTGNGGSNHVRAVLLVLQLAVWLWFTVLFANFAEAMAEGRGKAQADSLRKSRKDTMARRVVNGVESPIAAPMLEKGDVVICGSGDVIPADGEVIDGIASVDEAAITGESAPVIRESGGDRSAVTGGTKVISDRIVIRITSERGNTFLDRMIAMVEGASRQKTPNEIALTILLSALTLIFLLVVMTLKPYGLYAGVDFSTPVLIALLVCLIPTTIGGLLSAIGISGIDRLIRRNVMATSGRAVEAAGDIDVLLLDKTGTITIGNRMASDFVPAPGVTEQQLADAAQLASLADETPEGRSIVVLAKEKFNIRGRELGATNSHAGSYSHATFVPFTAQTRMSGVDFADEPALTFSGGGSASGGSASADNNNRSSNGGGVATASAVKTQPAVRGRSIRKGAADSVKQYVISNGGIYPIEVEKAVEAASRAGRTPLVVAERDRVMGVVELKDVVKGGIKERFAQLRKMGIRTVMITGDNLLTAAAIAAEAGVDDFMAQATPEDKLRRIRSEQAAGHLVAMTGDGTNDAPALAQADVGVAMNTGTQAAREAGNMVDLDSNPTKLIEIVEIGKQLLMTRGSLTTFSIANDVAKYFAIIPAMLMVTFPAIAPLNVMRLASPESAILSAVIFNALIIIALIPLALRGVQYRPVGAVAVLQRNLLIFGLGGLILPFIGIKAIDMLITALHIV